MPNGSVSNSSWLDKFRRVERRGRKTNKPEVCCHTNIRLALREWRLPVGDGRVMGASAFIEEQLAWLRMHKLNGCLLRTLDELRLHLVELYFSGRLKRRQKTHVVKTLLVLGGEEFIREATRNSTPVQDASGLLSAT
jgi:hypothetical protein